MALVSSISVLPLDSNHLLNYRAGNMMDNSGEIQVEPGPAVVLEKTYALVGKDKKDNKNILTYSVQNFPGRKIVIVHVHQPAQEIPTPLGKFHASKLKAREVKLYRHAEREDMLKMMNELLSFLTIHKRVQAEKLITEADDVQLEIVKMVAEHGISKLVMGAAAEKHHSRRMRTPKSKKAVFVWQQASPSCQISFVFKAQHVYTREANEEGNTSWIPPPSPALSIQSSISGQSLQLQHSVSLQVERRGGSGGVLDWITNRPRSYNTSSQGMGLLVSPITPRAGREMERGKGRLGSVDTIDEWPEIRSTASPGSSRTSWSTSTDQESDGAGSSGSRTMPRDEERVVNLSSVHESEEDTPHCTPSSELEDTRELEEALKQLELTRIEARNSKTEAFEESLKRKKAEEDAQDAIRKAKASENAYARVLNKRKESEEVLAQKMVERENLRVQINEVTEELQKACEQKLVLECSVSNSNRLLMETETKLRAAEEFLTKMQEERDELQRQRDEANAEAEELRLQHEAEMQAATAQNSGEHMNFAEFSYFELAEATNNFDEALKIGEGGYGAVYRGVLRHTEVAIKLLHPQSMQGKAEFQQEVDVLSRTRHPNLVTLMGTCPQAWSLVYEYLSNGSLEDRLLCKNNSPPLSWQTRTRIAAEICSALLFLHSAKPNGVIHGDLKPANILLDHHLVSKLGDFGICRLIPQGSSGTTLCRNTDPKGTFAYMDPEFQATGNLTQKSDVYSFGVVILRMLTGKPALGIVTEVKEAVEKGTLQEILDSLAGDWPFVQARQLAYLGLKCCELSRKNRPDLESGVWRVLQPMLASASSCRQTEDSARIPPYFICPIFQEIMSDPHIAADGYTYEAEALRGWLDSGHDTSPMTNLKLAHQNLIPNHALRSAIQEWHHQT